MRLFRVKNEKIFCAAVVSSQHDDSNGLSNPNIAFTIDQTQFHDVAYVILNPTAIANGGYVIRGEHYVSTSNDVMLILQGADRDARCSAICTSDLPNFYSYATFGQFILDV